MFVRHLLEHEVEEFIFSALPGAGFKLDLSPSDDLIMSAIVPGLDGTLNDGAGFPFRLEFTDEYPLRAPIVRATYEKRWHVQMYPSGHLESSLLHSERFWHASVCLKEVLLNSQVQMHSHDVDDPCINDPFVMARTKPGRCTYMSCPL